MRSCGVKNKLGIKTKGQTSKILGVHKSLCEVGKAEVLSGRLPFTAAAPIARLPDHEQQKQLIARCVLGELKCDYVAGEVNGLLGFRRPKEEVLKGRYGPAAVEVPATSGWPLVSERGDALKALARKAEKEEIGIAALPMLLKRGA